MEMKLFSERVFAAILVSFTALLARGAGPEKIAAQNGEIEISPINHATLALKSGNKTILVDPVGGAQKFESFTPDLVLVTDIHGDHMDPSTLKGLVKGKTKVIAPQAVAEKIPDLKENTIVLANGQKKEIDGISIEAIPMYNLTPDRLKFHAKGRGNGYVLTLGGKRIYISGDTEDIPEMRSLKNIDLAFVCMNLPYTMTVEQAASAVSEFKPKVVYPYHYRGSDTEKFKQLVKEKSPEVEVRIYDWYKK